MLNVVLVNVPFADWNRPSFALSQISTLLQQEFGEEVSVRVCYLNQDVAEYFGATMYEEISLNHDHVDTGLGDWLFRGIAFPETTDNADDYFRRYYRGERWEVFRKSVIELRAGLEELCADLIAKHGLDRADVVGFSSMFAQHVPSLALARLIKDRRPEIVTLLGGANCEAPMGAVIAERVPAVDFVFSGPALITLPRFIRHLLDDDQAAVDAIPGIVSERNARHPAMRRAIGADRPIDEVLRPDYASFVGSLEEHPTLRETGSAEPMLFFETSRGCWWGQRSHCTFCGLNGQGMDYRAMAPELAVEQFNWLFEFAPAYTSLFCTDNVMPKSYPREVFEKLDPPPGTSIYYEVKLPLSRQDIVRMVQAGVNAVQPGIEALASKTLKLMGKGTTAFHNLQFLKHCREFGMFPDWNLLIGFPREDPSVYEKYSQELPKLQHLPPPHNVYMVRFDRYSPYYNRRDEFELDLHPVDYYPLIYPFEAADIADLAYFFADQNIGDYTLNAIEWKDILGEQIREWREAWEKAGGPPCDLYLESDDDGRWWIFDTRSGKRDKHSVDGVTASIVQQLSSPIRSHQIGSSTGAGEAEIAERVGWLDDHGMLFHEDGKVFSLVQAPPTSAAEEELEEGIEIRPLRSLLPLLSSATVDATTEARS